MGGSSSSSVTQESDTNVTTQSSINAFNEQVNKNVVNSIMKNAQQSGGSITQLDTTNVGLLVASGHSTINLSLKDKQKARLSFKAIQESLQTSKLKDSLANQFAEQLANKTNTNTFNKLVSNAQSSMTSGLGSSLLDPGSSSNSSVDTNIKTNINTKQTTVLKNIIKSLVATNNTVQAIKTCFGNVFQDKTTNFQGVIASDYATVNISDVTDQIASAVLSCNQTSNQTNNIASSLAQLMGIKVSQEATTTTKTESTAIAKSKNVKKGLGDLISSIFGFFKGAIGMVIIGVIILCCLSVSGYVVYSKMKSKSSAQKGDPLPDQPGNGPSDDISSNVQPKEIVGDKDEDIGEESTSESGSLSIASSAGSPPYSA